MPRVRVVGNVLVAGVVRSTLVDEAIGGASRVEADAETTDPRRVVEDHVQDIVHGHDAARLQACVRHGCVEQVRDLGLGAQLELCGLRGHRAYL